MRCGADELGVVRRLRCLQFKTMKRRIWAFIFLLLASAAGSWLYQRLLVPANAPGDGGQNFAALFEILAAAISAVVFGLTGVWLFLHRPSRDHE